MFTREQAKVTLKARGWSYRRAARRLGVTYQHISYCLNGQRQSRRLLKAIAEIATVSPGEEGHGTE
jgi:transcriptional regulator with XRE-family HTH domain